MKLTDTYSRLAVYQNENYYLSRYLEHKDIDLPRYISEFMNWPGMWRHDLMERSHVDPGEFEEAIKDGSDSFYEMCSQIENHMTPEEKEEFSQFLRREKWAETPSWILRAIQRRRLPRQTWLVHFSGQAENISRKGFQRGVDDMTTLALTTWLDKESKKYGGYNFAFVADGLDSQRAAEVGDYGNQAVMFQASGVEVYHEGDEEHQVIFWGKAIDPTTMVQLDSDGQDWMVVPRRKSTMNQRGRDYVFKGDFHSVVNWVKSHWFQYRRQILGN